MVGVHLDRCVTGCKVPHGLGAGVLPAEGLRVLVGSLDLGLREVGSYGGI